MTISSRTPEGQPFHCPICHLSILLEPSPGTGDVTCPGCGCLLWPHPSPLHSSSGATLRKGKQIPHGACPSAAAIEAVFAAARRRPHRLRCGWLLFFASLALAVAAVYFYSAPNSAAWNVIFVYGIALLGLSLWFAHTLEKPPVLGTAAPRTIAQLRRYLIRLVRPSTLQWTVDVLLDPLPITDEDKPFFMRAIGIIDSMTHAERLKPECIDSRRAKRIASGSGVVIEDVRSLLALFQASCQLRIRLR